MITSASTAASESTAIASSATSTSTLAGLGFVHLDLLSVDSGAVHLPDGVLSGLLLLEGDEGVALAGVVNVSDETELLELALEKRRKKGIFKK